MLIVLDHVGLLSVFTGGLRRKKLTMLDTGVKIGIHVLHVSIKRSRNLYCS